MPGKRRITTIRRHGLSFGEAETSADAASPRACRAVRGRASRCGCAASAGVGVVSRVAGTPVEVLVDGKRLWVDLGDCEPVAPARPASRGHQRWRPTRSRARRAQAARPHPGGRPRAELERFLDHAVLLGRPPRAHRPRPRHRYAAPHGPGDAEAHPAVARFAHPPQNRGGTGVTEAELE